MANQYEAVDSMRNMRDLADIIWHFYCKCHGQPTTISPDNLRVKRNPNRRLF